MLWKKGERENKNCRIECLRIYESYHTNHFLHKITIMNIHPSRFQNTKAIFNIPMKFKEPLFLSLSLSLPLKNILWKIEASKF